MSIEEETIGGVPTVDRVMGSARREAEWKWPGLRMDPRVLSCAYRALADYMLLLYAQDFHRDDRAPMDTLDDAAIRTGRFMHHLADKFSDIAYDVEQADVALIDYLLERPGGPRFQLEHSSEVLVAVHDESLCEGRPCTIHNMSDHHMRSFPQHWRSDRGFIERICPHGVGHPDPDEGWESLVHGCCAERCCAPKQEIA